MDEIKPILEKLNKADASKLERRGLEFNFSDVSPFIEEIFANVKVLENNPEFWNKLPENQRNNIKSYLEHFLQYVEKIQNFNPTQVSNPQSERDGIANNIKNNYNQFYEHLFPRLKLYVLEKEFSAEKIEALLKQANENIEAIKKQKEQGDEILKAMREASAITGVSKFAAVFGNEAKTNKKTANKWLVASIASAVGIGLFLWWIFSQLLEAIKDDAGFEVSLQVFLAKILLLSFFSVVFYQVIKNYNANMHLYTLNKHRENSLKSFQSFVESTEDPKIRDTVLIQATKAIFEAGETGYVSSKDGNITGLETIKIVDQFREK
jgi:hypothetical protein